MTEPRKRNLPKKGKPPDWPPEVRQLVIDWLHLKLQHLAAARDKLKQMLKIANLDWIRKNLDYYEHAMGATRWLIYAAGGRPRGRATKPKGPIHEPGVSSEGGEQRLGESESVERGDGGSGTRAAS